MFYRSLLPVLGILMMVTANPGLRAQTLQPSPAPVTFVNPLIGTFGEGNTFPGSVAPFGMIQISPDTEDNLWETASGYEYSDSSIIDFSLTHFSGTGIPDLGDIRFMPQVGKPWFVQGPKSNPDSGYRARYSHATNRLRPGIIQ